MLDLLGDAPNPSGKYLAEYVGIGRPPLVAKTPDTGMSQKKSEVYSRPKFQAMGISSSPGSMRGMPMGPSSGLESRTHLLLSPVLALMLGYQQTNSC